MRALPYPLIPPPNNRKVSIESLIPSNDGTELILKDMDGPISTSPRRKCLRVAFRAFC